MIITCKLCAAREIALRRGYGGVPIDGLLERDLDDPEVGAVLPVHEGLHKVYEVTVVGDEVLDTLLDAVEVVLAL